MEYRKLFTLDVKKDLSRNPNFFIANGILFCAKCTIPVLNKWFPYLTLIGCNEFPQINLLILYNFNIFNQFNINWNWKKRVACTTRNIPKERQCLVNYTASAMATIGPIIAIFNTSHHDYSIIQIASYI